MQAIRPSHHANNKLSKYNSEQSCLETHFFPFKTCNGLTCNGLLGINVCLELNQASAVCSRMTSSRKRTQSGSASALTRAPLGIARHPTLDKLQFRLGARVTDRGQGSHVTDVPTSLCRHVSSAFTVSGNRIYLSKLVSESSCAPLLIELLD